MALGERLPWGDFGAECGIDLPPVQWWGGLKNGQQRRVEKGYMGVSKNRSTPKWMVYNGKPY